VTCKDLTFADENPDKIGNLINFSKHRLVYNIVNNALRFQKGDYKFPEVEEIKSYLHSLPIMEEKELYNLSLTREPRNASRADVI
jgi:hypothetical protein